MLSTTFDHIYFALKPLRDELRRQTMSDNDVLAIAKVLFHPQEAEPKNEAELAYKYIQFHELIKCTPPTPAMNEAIRKRQVEFVESLIADAEENQRYMRSPNPLNALEYGAMWRIADQLLVCDISVEQVAQLLGLPVETFQHHFDEWKNNPEPSAERAVLEMIILAEVKADAYKRAEFEAVCHRKFSRDQSRDQAPVTPPAKLKELASTQPLSGKKKRTRADSRSIGIVSADKDIPPTITLQKRPAHPTAKTLLRSSKRFTNRL